MAPHRDRKDKTVPHVRQSVVIHKHEGLGRLPRRGQQAHAKVAVGSQPAAQPSAVSARLRSYGHREGRCPVHPAARMAYGGNGGAATPRLRTREFFRNRRPGPAASH